MQQFTKLGKSRIVLLFMIVVLSAIVVTTFGWALWSAGRLFGPNIRMYSKGCITATARLDGHTASYVHLEIGSRKAIYNRLPGFEVELENSTILAFPQTFLADFKTLAYKNRPATEFLELDSSAIQYVLGGCNIVFSKNRVIQVTLYGYEGVAKVRIRTAGSNGWRTMPLSDGDLVDLFGQPDRLWDDWRH